MAKKEKDNKTNVMRLLEQAGVEYTPHCYLETGAISGTDVALAMGENPEQVFKTLVTVGKSGENFVFVIPVNAELNLKKAASSVGDKAVSMIKSKELLGLTGYIHGGCSPIGMKKQFKTVFDESAFLFDSIYFSAGKIGYQVELDPNDLSRIIEYSVSDLTDYQ